MVLEYIVKDERFENVKQVLKEQFQISDRLLLKLKTNKKIYLNSSIASVNDKVKKDDHIEVYIDFEEDNSNILPSNMPLYILYEDDNLLIVDKPSGIPVHPSRAHFENTLSNGIAYYFNQINLKKKIRPINRLDKDTSGIVIFAKNEYVQECLIKQMKTNEFKKQYIAIVKGVLNEKKGIIDLPISRKEGSIIEREVNPLGQYAITRYKVVKEKDNISLLYIFLETGRTHQIRVHFSHLNHPILGDTLYGSASNLISRQALHAYKIQFTHPITKNIIEIISPLSSDMKSLI